MNMSKTDEMIDEDLSKIALAIHKLLSERNEIFKEILREIKLLSIRGQK